MTPNLLLQGPAGGNILFQIFPFVLIFAVFYFLIIRPQQQKQRQAQKAREEMLNSLKSGDKIITSGGIYGTVVGLKENTVQVKIATSVSIEVLRTAISGLQSADIKEVEPVK